METNPTPTGIGSVCINVGDEHHVTAIIGDSGIRGSVFVGESWLRGVVQFAATPDQLRGLAAALIEGADDLDAQIAARTDADIERERAADHYGAMAEEAGAEARTDKAQHDLDLEDWAVRP